MNGYFHRVTDQTSTRLWVNNPTDQEAELAIAAGAISCTTNPTFSAVMLRSQSQGKRTLDLVKEISSKTSEDDKAADLVQQELVKGVMEKFHPLYGERPGTQGLVSIQGDPHRDDDPDHIVNEALRYRNLGDNFIAKIPVTQAGLAAIEVLIAEGVPVIATEVFAISQMIETCERYQRVSDRTGRKPPFYVTHISGIFDEYLAKTLGDAHPDLPAAVLSQAGCAIARRQYRIMQERNYPGILLGGGARGTHHFTEMVGGTVHVTLNWSTIEQIVAADCPVTSRIQQEMDPADLAMLTGQLPDFRKAFLDDGLAPEEFSNFGPLLYFRDKFVTGWESLLATIRQIRSSASSRPAGV